MLLIHLAYFRTELNPGIQLTQDSRRQSDAANLGHNSGDFILPVMRTLFLLIESPH